MPIRKLKLQELLHMSVKKVDKDCLSSALTLNTG